MNTSELLSGRRVLVIDDDVNFGEEAVCALARAGAAARYHRGPFGSLHAIREMRSDVVLLDVNMPRMDGAQIVRAIRTADGIRDVRVLLCSNMDLRVLERLAATLKAHGAVPKAAFEDGTATLAIARVIELHGDPERARK
ncbi:response regulator [Sorangium sp. So ce131]|uniref:response regulator n=1 Tax=Sorangium sp. So ce131 TaxID=3133282 RepID=UPI003F606FCA